MQLQFASSFAAVAFGSCCAFGLHVPYPGERKGDPRNIAGASNSALIYGPPQGSRTGYSDQPQLAFSPTDDQEWYIVLTRGTEKEGQNLEWVQGYRSFDGGNTWQEDTPIRPSNPFGPPSAWVNVLQAPRSQRLWATYTYNINNVTRVPGYEGEQRNDMWGVQMVVSSPDLGRTWSTPAVIPPVTKAIDRSNVFNGSTLCGWSVGKPVITDTGRVLQQFTKRYSGTQKPTGLDYVPMEQFLLASDDLVHTPPPESTTAGPDIGSTGLTQGTPAQQPPLGATWETLPLSERGINATAGLLAEEGDVLLLPAAPGEQTGEGSQTIAYIYRTFSGYLNAAFSLDGTRGALWTPAQTMPYARQGYPNATYRRDLKNPNGPTSPRSFATSDIIGTGAARSMAAAIGRTMPSTFVLVPYYANGDNVSPHRYLWRNPYMLSCGVVKYSDDSSAGSGKGIQTIVWGEPGILAYDPYAFKHGIGYPDLLLRNVSAAGGTRTELLFAETNKIQARLHRWNATEFLFGTSGDSAGLCVQPLLQSQPKAGLVLRQAGSGNGSAVTVRQPPLPDRFTTAGQGLTLDASVATTGFQAPNTGSVSLLRCAGEHAGTTAAGWLTADWEASPGGDGRLCVNASVAPEAGGQLLVVQGCSDPAAPVGGKVHVSAVFDGAARLLRFVTNGAFSDGGAGALTGLVELPANGTVLGPQVAAGGSEPTCTVGGGLEQGTSISGGRPPREWQEVGLLELFVYQRALSTSQLVSAHQSRGLPPAGW